MTWFLNGHLCEDDFVLDTLRCGEEVLPEEEAWPGYISWQGRLAPDNEGLDLIVLVDIDSEAFEVLRRLDNDDLGLGVLRLIQARFCLVRDVDASIDLVVHDGSHESHGPLWSVEAHDSDSRAGRAAELMACLRELQRVLPVLTPGPA